MPQITAKEAFDYIMLKCHPYSNFNYLVDVFFFGREANFHGGCGDYRTAHEKVFSLMFPDLQSQVPFGTGKGGYKKYRAKRYIADFYDPDRKIIYEIDGTNHKREIEQLKDKIRDYFFYHELGIRTIRLTNKDIENLLMKRLLQLEEKGVLADAIGPASESQRSA
jgi:Uncharacterized protein conserved in bacteria